MANKALKKLKDELSCLICLDRYCDPRLLKCSHAFCHQCLVNLAVQDHQGKLIVSCPACRQITPIPDERAGLPPAFRLNNLLEITAQLKDYWIWETTNPAVTQATTKVFCSVHAHVDFGLYCET